MSENKYRLLGRRQEEAARTPKKKWKHFLSTFPDGQFWLGRPLFCQMAIRQFVKTSRKVIDKVERGETCAADIWSLTILITQIDDQNISQDFITFKWAEKNSGIRHWSSELPSPSLVPSFLLGKDDRTEQKVEDIGPKIFKLAIPFFILFLSLQANNTIIATISVKKWSSSIWWWNSNLQYLEHKSSPVTTRRGQK